MNILITGNVSSLATALIKDFTKEKNRVIVASSNASKIDIQMSNLIVHSINPSEPIFRDALASYTFDVMIYLSTREEQLINREDDFYIGQQLDGLRNSLELCKKGEVKRFFYISSTEVYGDMTDDSEKIAPQAASLNGDTLLVGEKYCRSYQSNYEMNITILRLTHIYGPEEKDGLIYKLITDGNQKNEVVIPGEPNTLCSFLHSNDVIDFIRRAIDEEYAPESLVINLSSSKPIKLSDLAKILEKYYSSVIFDFENARSIYTRPVTVSAARKQFDWFDTHNLILEIGDFVDPSSTEIVATEASPFQKLFNQISKYPKVLKWSELFLGAILAMYLSQLTGTLIQFQYVDFRLVYVVIMGSIYGLQFGLAAAVLMSLFVMFTWLNLGVDWRLLVYNVGNWFPFVMYFAVGLIVGYNHDKTENTIVYERKQYDLVMEKYSFLYEVFNEIRDLKDEFRERLIGYRDSLGKIFTITRELDELQEHAVYLRSLNILEDLMDNKNIAIYSLDSNRAYARLEVNSADMGRKIAKSMKLADFPLALELIDQGKIFQNKDLLEHYPAYIAPVLNNAYPFNVPVAMIVIWAADFEQYSLYYYNLFKVICGMIQASLVRATSFLDANYEKIYLPNTRILNHDAFIDILKVRLEMRKNKISDFQIIELQEPQASITKIYPKISAGIRTADVVGLLSNGKCYVLLSQADKGSSLDVIERLNQSGVRANLIEANEVPLI